MTTELQSTTGSTTRAGLKPSALLERLMTNRTPQAPFANRSAKGLSDPHEIANASTHAKRPGDLGVSEQGVAVGVIQKTMNKGFFLGRKIK